MELIGPLVGGLVAGIIIAVALFLCAGKVAQAITDRPVAVPQVIAPPAPPVSAPSTGGRSPGIRVAWEDKEIEFTEKDAAGILSELISDVFRDLTAQDKMLLKNIFRSHNTGKLHRLPEDFRRGSQEHQYYRRLRDSHLIRPVEGKFLPAVRIEMTEFGMSVIQRFPELLESDDTGVGVPALSEANA